VWFVEFSQVLSQYVLAYITQRWYFTPYVNEEKVNLQRKVIFKAYCNACCKHFGSLALGSLILGTCRIPLKIVRFIAKAVDVGVDHGNPCCRCLSATCCCCVIWLGRELRHVHRNAYLGMGLTSENFCQAAISADNWLYSGNRSAMIMLNGMQGVFETGGLVAIVALTSLGTIAALEVFDILGPTPELYDIVVCLAVVSSFPVSLGYMTVFDTVGDTILLCWVVQARRYQYHSERIQDVLGRPGLQEGFLGSFYRRAQSQEPTSNLDASHGRARRTLHAHRASPGRWVHDMSPAAWLDCFHTIHVNIHVPLMVAAALFAFESCHN